MSFNLQDYLDLKEKVEQAKKEAQKADWELEKLMKELKDAYNCETVDQAEALQAKVQKQVKKAEQQYQAEMTSFLDKWEHRFDEE